jgi:hypothetical protein
MSIQYCTEVVIEGRRADLTIRGLWQLQEVAFLDIRVVDSDAASYVDKPAMDVLKAHEEEKVRKYNDSCAAMGGSFTPFVISADGVLAPQAWKVIQTLAAQLTEKRNSQKKRRSTGSDCASSLHRFELRV